MSKPTPGPWEMEHQDWKGEPSPHRVYISGDKHESYDDDDGTTSMVATSVCIVEGNATSRETTAANARLIAQAPALLAACEALLGSRVGSAEEEAALVAMRKAVASATGDGMTLAVIARLERRGTP